MKRHREIGGYFELELNHGTYLHEGAIALNCGRGCLAYVIEARGVREMWLPDYLCDVVANQCVAQGVSVHTYTVGPSFEPLWDFEVKEGQWLYLNDYYGQLSDSCVETALEVSGGRLVIDETQGYFSSPRTGVDTLYTCRKYLGVPDGGFLYTMAPLEHELERDVSWPRMTQVLGRFEEGSAAFFKMAQENNDVFVGHGARRISLLTENLLRGIDYDAVRTVREANFDVLASELGDINPLAISMPAGPFAYPFLVEDGPQARRALASEGVFVPTLWPNVVDEAPHNTVAYRYARDILPLPVDQRYSAEDMAYVLEMLHKEGLC